MSNIKRYLFRGVDTDTLIIYKDNCMDKLDDYLSNRKDCRALRFNNLMYILDKDHNHCITLDWHDYGFHVDQSFKEMNAHALEVVLVAQCIVFRSLCEHHFDTTLDKSDDTEVTDEVSDEEDYWI